MQKSNFLEEHEWLSKKGLTNCLNNSGLERKIMTSYTPAEQTITENFLREPDLINLMDDFSISPQLKNNNRENFEDLQMKELINFVQTSGKCNLQDCGLTKDQERQYKMFFDKYETYAKSDDGLNKNLTTKQETGITTFYGMKYEDYIGTPKVLIPKLNVISNEEEHEINEDLIEEVLLDKNIEKDTLRSFNTSNLQKFYDETVILGKIDIPNPSRNRKISPSPIDKRDIIMDEIISSNDINFTTTLPTQYDKSKHINNNLIFSTNAKLNQHPSINNEELVTKHDIKYLETMKIDEKLKRSSTFKTEAEKLHLTAGPTLAEKSVVLPQIMKRLTDRKRELEKDSNLVNKLVLDNGSFEKTSENIQNFEIINQTAHLKLSNNDNKIDRNCDYNFLGGAPKNLLPGVHASGPKSNQIGSAENDSIHGETRFVPVEKLKALKREKDIGQDIAEYINVGSHISRPPQLLIKDCNKDRYVSYATSHLFNDFVNGK